MYIQRVDELTHPPVIGETYLVPGVVKQGYEGWNTQKDAWVPVIGTKHWDKDFDPAIPPHIHRDLRFFTEEEWKIANDAFVALTAISLKSIIGEVTYQERVCLREFPYYTGWKSIWVTGKAIGSMKKEYQIKMTAAPAAKGPKGWLCPHKGADLSTAEVKDGVITCPLHGLKFCSKTGENVTLSVDKG